LLDGVGGVIEEAHDLKDADNPRKSRFRIKVVTSGEPRKSLPDGLVLSLIFEVKGDAVPKTVVPLKIEKLSVTDVDTPPGDLAGSVGRQGSIEVILPEEVPIMPCFFFSH
jgi:hypothetical protein